MRGGEWRRVCRILTVMTLALPACLTPAALVAQATLSSIRGTVSGAGSAIAGAHVAARSRETGASRAIETDASGRFQILGLSPGPYDVIVRAVGWQPQRQAVELVLDTQRELDFALAGAAVTLDTMVVTAPARSAIERLDISTAILPAEIEGLPLNSRDVLALSSIAPGVRSFATRDGRAIPSAGAASTPRFVNLYVDGSEWKGFATGALVGQPQTGSLIPQEAVREYRVLLNPYDAEYAHGASWVMSAVTHEGGNQVEGSMFAFHQNADLVARGTYQQGSASYRRTQLGGNVRGPLVRGRLFYALSYEGQLTDDVIDVVPGRPANDPGIWDRYAGSFSSPTRNEMGMLRVTALAARHSLDATWLTRQLSNEGNFGGRQGTATLVHEAGLRGSYRVNNVQLRDRYVAPRWLNDLTLSLLDNSTSEVPLVPGVARRYTSIQTGRPAYPSVIFGRQVAVADRVLLPLRGRGGEHLLKAGVEALHLAGRAYLPTNRDGLFIFDDDTSSLPSRAQIGLGFLHPDSDADARTRSGSWSLGGYLQDQWRPTPSLTLLLGARYDADLNTLGQHRPAPWARDTLLERIVGDGYLNTGDRVNDLNNLAPRVAISWEPSGAGRIALRAGYGVMYDRVPVTGAVTERVSWTWRVYSRTNPGTTDPDALRRMVRASGGASAPSLTLLPDRMETPSTRQWSVGMSRRLGDRLTVSTDYLDQRMRKLPVTVVANGRNPVTMRRPLTSVYGDITLWGSFGDATWRALLSSLRFDGPATQWSAAYTLGFARSEFGAVTTSGFGNPSLYRMQRSDGDERHRIVLSGMARAPYGLRLSTIAIAASPRPFFVTTGADGNQDGASEDDWPGGIRTWKHHGWAYWYRTVDARVAKEIAAPQGALLISLDVFNLANWANHSDYQPAQNLSGFTEPTGDYARRQAQLGVRYRF